MIAYYIKKYVPLLRLELVTLIADESGELVAFGVALPSLSRAMQKARGRMFPLGACHLLRALNSNKAEVCDLMLIAAHPTAQNLGAAALLFTEMIPQFQKLGTVYAESNPELIDNYRIQALWGTSTRYCTNEGLSSPKKSTGNNPGIQVRSHPATGRTEKFIRSTRYRPRASASRQRYPPAVRQVHPHGTR